ncbi:peptidoglycan editing factor PgeF [Aquibacillus sp. 3ASR75-11]|uniref:Purine nucleoside phosphorylase n=1 Tax=Terrihalobacillus insolitus TaxID=2950438 RepID=A0A9X3WUS6_9BACI|nr:peptidoglycan editing factor PgeF [Terrihalobacillus insolitus]MDC3412845.1 peptidoglycan editing factor PgeF [Terrihalobacillus insolitus]MDC3423679.1 peptidoglycan editing factor PgeF [Terrihalobacillus insolitus]
MADSFQRTNLSYLSLKEWESVDDRLRVGISTRKGGISRSPYRSMNLGLHVPDKKEDVIANRNKLAHELEFPLEQWVFAEQIHGTDIAVVTAEQKGKGIRNHHDAIIGCDGMITNKKGVLLTALFADCVPLYFFDPITKWIGIAHAGWRGSVHEMAKVMVDKLKEVGVEATNIQAAIGPCIGKTQYEVDDKVISHIPHHFKEKTTKPTKNGHYMLDLKRLNHEILLQAGIQNTHIHISNYCTFEEDETFFSHRRDNGKTGRMIGFIGYHE